MKSLLFVHAIGCLNAIWLHLHTSMTFRHFYKGEQISSLPVGFSRGRRPSKKGLSTLKGEDVLLNEHSFSLRVGPQWKE